MRLGGFRKLQAARQRVADLEDDLQSVRERAERADQWLAKISAEIEGRLVRKGS